MTDTIFAVSSGRPPAAIAVMRLSGPDALSAAGAIAGALPAPRRAGLRSLVDPVGGDLIDRAIVLVFPGPDSATGEDLVEFHLHGGRAVIAAVSNVLAGRPGLRAAEAGEFTRRGLQNGRIDLTEAEGLADLLAAETEGQRRAAMRVAEGGLRRLIDTWTRRAVDLAAAVEVAIDHSDEGDVDESAIVAPVRLGVLRLADEIAVALSQPPAERLRDGLRVVLAGPPNSGKSTLFNAMAGRDAAIVSPIAGTTRDRIEAPVQRDGIAWLLTDTAGLADETDDPIEAIGIARSRDALAAADIVLWLGDDAAPGGAAIAIHGRCDAPGRSATPHGRIAASGHAAGGTDAVWKELGGRAQAMLPGEDAMALNARQRLLCTEAELGLRTAAGTADDLLMAEELRVVLRAFDALTGRADTEHVLDALFGRFCIGK